MDESKKGDWVVIEVFKKLAPVVEEVIDIDTVIDELVVAAEMMVLFISQDLLFECLGSKGITILCRLFLLTIL